jgi:hypothetical protein
VKPRQLSPAKHSQPAENHEQDKQGMGDYHEVSKESKQHTYLRQLV